ncbi:MULTISPECIES: hypothetical protein [Bacillati]|uniref:Uncharacterized protein n=2 Tax=Arthrobacter russicus TaxID=172040 RepID=A0ABU1JDY5_9MICC|nr:hypothetical protein [Arthrobacter russicus]MDR6268889.1 hypothetical protein [Arthrobacter russicus]MDR6270633.1 hypothetical protein [Arthrobacter russicus]
MNTTPTIVNVSALTERIAEVRTSRDTAAWKSAQALLRSDTSEALDWAEMAAEDDREMTALQAELRTLRQAQA